MAARPSGFTFGVIGLRTLSCGATLLQRRLAHGKFLTPRSRPSSPGPGENGKKFAAMPVT
jgi:hypothetical protein